MKPPPNNSRTRRVLIVETWNARRQPPVGEKLLREIQRVVETKFGAGAVESPAAIARVLADEGAELLHPEVIEFDARWRKKRLKTLTADNTRSELVRDKPHTFKTIEAFLVRCGELRQQFETENNREELRKLREMILNEKSRAQLLARDEARSAHTRAVQSEIAQWIRIWLQTPVLFRDWLELRRQSPDFQTKFPDE
jgi:hypothetical protein